MTQSKIMTFGLHRFVCRPAIPLLLVLCGSGSPWTSAAPAPSSPSTSQAENHASQKSSQTNDPAVPGITADAQKIFHALIEAVGGAAAIRSVRSLITEADVTVVSQGVKQQGIRRNVVLFPDDNRVEMKFGDVEILQVVRKDRGWAKIHGKTTQLPSATVESLRKGMMRDWISLLKEGLKRETRLEAVDSSTLLLYPATGDRLILSINPKSGLPKTLSYRVPDPFGLEVEARDEYSDFQRVEGILYPHKISITQGGEEAGTHAVKSIRINAPIEPSLFELAP